MRFLDYWAGVPLCWLLSLLNQFIGVFSRGKLASDGKLMPKRLMFIQLTEIGSMVLAAPAVADTLKSYPDALCFYLVFERNREVPELIGSIPKERVIVISSRSLLAFCRTTISALARIRRARIDTVIDFELFSRCSMLLSFLSGARTRIGFFIHRGEGLYRGRLLTHEVLYNFQQHMAKNFLALCRSIGKPARATEPLLKEPLPKEVSILPVWKANLEQEQNCSRKLAQLCPGYQEGASLIVLNPDPGELMPVRGWPLEHYSALTQALTQRYPSTFFAIVGRSSARPYAQALQKAVPPDRFVDLISQTGRLDELLTVLSRASLLITNDSGPAHLAALTRTPTLVFYGPETPALYGVLNESAKLLYAGYSCSPCLSVVNNRNTPCTDSQCLRAISTNTALVAALELLTKLES